MQRGWARLTVSAPIFRQRSQGHRFTGARSCGLSGAQRSSGGM